MKKLKTILSMAMIFALVMALSVTAFADPMSITVKNAIAGQSYTLYKIFDATVNEAREDAVDASENTEVQTPGINYTLPTGKSLATEYTYTDSSNVSHTVKGADWFHTDVAGNVWLNTGADITTEEFREWAKQFGTSVDTKTNSGSAAADVVFNTGLDSGYYFITTTTGTLVTVTSIAPNALVKDKNTPPSMTKVVSGGTEVGSATAAVDQEANTASVNDVLTYKATISAKPNAKNYVFEDSMDAGLTLINYDDSDAQNIVDLLVQVGGTNLVRGDDYVLNVFDPTATPEIRITFTQEYLDSLSAETDIVITYKARVNAGAVIAGNGNVNTATLKWGANATEITDTVTTKAYQFGLYKTATIESVDHTILDGAKFELYDAQTGGNKIELILDGGVYRPVMAGETAVKVDVGSAVISGLKNGTYWLEETDAPAGYNKLTARQQITLTDANNVGTVTSGVYQYVDDDNDPETPNVASGGLEVVNVAGTLLPDTGGIGTTIFYVGGAVLMVAAGISFVMKKRYTEMDTTPRA